MEFGKGGKEVATCIRGLRGRDVSWLDRGRRRDVRVTERDSIPTMRGLYIYNVGERVGHPVTNLTITHTETIMRHFYKQSVPLKKYLLPPDTTMGAPIYIYIVIRRNLKKAALS